MLDMALRLTCTYEGEKITVISRERLEMVNVKRATCVEDFDQKIGFWLELRGSQGELLYRQVLDDRFQSDIEVFQDPNEGGWRHCQGIYRSGFGLSCPGGSRSSSGRSY